MSFRERLYKSAALVRAPSSMLTTQQSTKGAGPTGTNNLNMSFSAKESRRSLTKEEFGKVTGQTVGNLIAEIDEETERHLGFAYSRTRRQGIDDILVLINGASDSPEEAMACLCGASALSDADLIRLTVSDVAAWKRLLNQDVNAVRCAAVYVCSQISTRIWTWFSASQAFETVEDFDSAQQDIRNWVIQIWRAIADKTCDDDELVTSAAFDVLDEMARKQFVLFERVARHLLPIVVQVVARSGLIRSASAIRFSSKLLKFALHELHPHPLNVDHSSVTQIPILHAVQAFVRLSLIPLTEGTDALNGDVCLTSGEAGLEILEEFAIFSEYETCRIKASCANAALTQLRVLESTDLLLPDSARRQRKRRCARILFKAGESPSHLPVKQRIRVLGRCVSVCCMDSSLKELLHSACTAIIHCERDHPSEGAIQVLISNERGIRRGIWKGSDKPKHRLAYALFVGTLKVLRGLPVHPEKKKRIRSELIQFEQWWSDFTVTLLENFTDCLGWGDSSFRNHAAGHAFVDLLTNRLFYSSTNVDAPGLERLLRNIIEYKIQTCSNVLVKARLLWVCSRAFCTWENPDNNLGQALVNSARVLASLTDATVIKEIGYSSPSPFGTSLASGGDCNYFVVALSILASLARNVASIKNAVGEAYGYLSLKAKDLSVHERRYLEERTKEIERPRSFAFSRLSLTTTTTMDTNGARLSRGNLGAYSVTYADRSLVVRSHKKHITGSLLNRSSPEHVHGKQLSGGNDPLYVQGFISKSNELGRLICQIKVFNVSNISQGNLSLRFACRGDVRTESGQDSAQQIAFDSYLKPGGMAQWKFSLYYSVESSAFSVKRGIDVRMSTQGNMYSLATWWFPVRLWIRPKEMPLEQFRYSWRRFTGSTTKCEARLSTDSTESSWFNIFSKACRNFHLVSRSTRIAMYSTETIDKKELVLVTCQVTSPASVSLDFRSVERSLLVAFDARDAFSDMLFPNTPAHIIWSGTAFWPGSHLMKEDRTEADDFVAPDAVFSCAVMDTPETLRPLALNLDSMLQKWKRLKM
jgi:hypothetical protein